jgi:hypothetical protein
MTHIFIDEHGHGGGKKEIRFETMVHKNAIKHKKGPLDFLASPSTPLKEFPPNPKLPGKPLPRPPPPEFKPLCIYNHTK